MKKLQKLLLILLPSALVLASCEKWVDVEPKTQVENTRLFSNEQGFLEALNGVYIKMGTTPLYGRELTFGLTDVIGGMYNLTTTDGSIAYRDAFAGNYNNATIRPTLDAIWSNAYNAVANLNSIIEQLEAADPNIFSAGQYNVIKGEALGLRAFLHFDMLRLYGTSLQAATDQSPGVPYVTEYKPIVTPRLTVKITMDKIITDLDAAEKLLETDPLYSGKAAVADRKIKFNYYAVKATQARAYLWKGDTAKALAAAESIIAAAPVKFPFVSQAQVATSEAARNRVFTSEHIFGLFVNKLANNYVNLLDTSKFTSSLVISTSRIAEQFESASVGSSDYRNVYLIRNLSAVGPSKIFYGKLYQPAGMIAAYAKTMPLIKIPELYYIAAECLKETDPAKAITYINLVRASRGISIGISASASALTIQNEIRKEYWKEMPSEGQMFYYYKRVNSLAIPGVTGTYPTARYVLPLPLTEQELGN